MGGDAVTSVDEYDATMREMRDTMGKVAIAVGTKLIPKITQLVQAVLSIGESPLARHQDHADPAEKRLRHHFRRD